jgi:hypothetical protein
VGRADAPAQSGGRDLPGGGGDRRAHRQRTVSGGNALPGCDFKHLPNMQGHAAGPPQRVLATAQAPMRFGGKYRHYKHTVVLPAETGSLQEVLPAWERRPSRNAVQVLSVGRRRSGIRAGAWSGKLSVPRWTLRTSSTRGLPPIRRADRCTSGLDIRILLAPPGMARGSILPVLRPCCWRDLCLFDAPESPYERLPLTSR